MCNIHRTEYDAAFTKGRSAVCGDMDGHYTAGNTPVTGRHTNIAGFMYTRDMKQSNPQSHRVEWRLPGLEELCKMKRLQRLLLGVTGQQVLSLRSVSLKRAGLG